MLVDQQSINDFLSFITDVRKAVQDAYSIAKIADHLKELEEDPDSVRSDYYGFIRECADSIMVTMDKYCLDFKPENPFDDEESHGLPSPDTVSSTTQHSLLLSFL